MDNLKEGWTLDEVQQEFDDFFRTHDASIIEDEHADSDKF